MNVENKIKIEARRFPVVIRHGGTGMVSNDHIVISLNQLHACEVVGQSSKEYIHRLYGRKGYRILDIGKAEKQTLHVDLGELWKA